MVDGLPTWTPGPGSGRMTTLYVHMPKKKLKEGWKTVSSTKDRIKF